jgi:hypothetical protein
MERVELLWKEREDGNQVINEKASLWLSDFLGIESINEETIADADMSDDII